MKKKVTAAVIALLMAPSLSMAMCSDSQHISASSCKDGYSWDQAKGECILKPTT